MAEIPPEHDTALVVTGNELVCTICGTTVLVLPPELMHHTYVDPNAPAAEPAAEDQ